MPRSQFDAWLVEFTERTDPFLSWRGVAFPLLVRWLRRFSLWVLLGGLVEEKAMATAVPVARGRTSMSTGRGGHEANMGIMSTTRTTGTSTPSTRLTMTTTEEAAMGGTATEGTTAEVVGRAAAESRKAAEGNRHGKPARTARGR